MPVSGITQHWDNYAMAQVSWFLFRPRESKHPYDHWLAIHLNLGTKVRYDAGETDYAMEPYWAAGFEAGTFTKDFCFISETFKATILNMKKSFRPLATASGITTPVDVFRAIGLAYRANRLWRARRAVGAFLLNWIPHNF